MTAANMSVGTRRSLLHDADERPAYLALLWQSDGSQAAHRAHAVVKVVRQEWSGLETAVEDPGFLLLLDRTKQHRTSRGSSGASIDIIGSHFPRRRSRASGMAPTSIWLSGHDATHRMAERLVEEGWGSYVAFFRDGETRRSSVLRDPSGALRTYVVRHEGLTIVSPSLPRQFLQTLGFRPRVDRSALRDALANPTFVTFRSLIDDVETVPAGATVRLDGDRSPARQIWQPHAVARAPGLDDRDEAAGALREDVLLACRTLLSGCNKVVLELSGGLDSAIVLGVIASSEQPPAITCVNYATGYLEGDERDHARAAAEKWKALLLEMKADENEFDLKQIERLRQPLEPLLYGLDFVVESATGMVADEFGAHAIATGQAGDAVFFQLPSASVATDYARHHGLAAFWSDVAFDACRRASCSIWRVWADMLLHRWMHPIRGIGQFDRSLLDAEQARRPASEFPRHPWLENAAELPPAKRLQIEALANCQIFYGPTSRSAISSLVHPLMAQPVVERCLSIPTYQLARGQGDRAMARDAFSDLVPGSILRRRSKGEASSYYVRTIIENLPFLRSFLLEGTLAANGLLDYAALDALLDRDVLVWSDKGRLLLVYTSFEAWARGWSL